MLAAGVLLWPDRAIVELAKSRQGKGGYACGERELCKLFYPVIGMNYG